MTKPRALVSASLAERGRPEMWANEAESAALSGLSSDDFRTKRQALEAKGFPRVNPLNGQRFIPAIIDFWRRDHESGIAPAKPKPRGQQHLENWGDNVQ
jgi:hypothetical protein